MKRFTTLRIGPAVAMALAIGLSACGGGGASKTAAPAPSADAGPVHFSVVSASTLTPEDAAAAPAKPALDVTGLVSRTNAPGTFSLDVATLERLRTVSASIYEPFVKRDITFSGVLVSDVLAAAGADPAAREVFITALDDYTFTISGDVIRAGEVLLATRAGGKPIPIADGGPIRIVFSDESEAGKITDAWVWSVRTFDVR